MSRFAPLLLALAGLSLCFFPWPAAALLALLAAPAIPAAPAAVGLAADALYLPHGAFPLATALGALAALLALLVRSRLAPGILEQ
ncbi:MAG: hypothetical protein KGI78_03535 [Patescibacteria group bacterium]|nr:hypothetical protein [Patescibacteria group bacterium]MDE1944018.1 hypothetical protein [Patescibacteria group bacterium]MDE2057899.1 hypothetical protein [Patescibacteria group bacterium]